MSSATEPTATHSPAARDWAGLIACLFSAAFVFSLSWFKLSSLDTGYHLAYGQHFLETGRIVGFEPDPFLLPETGIPFVNANWGSQVIMALVERAGGAAGLTALRIGLIATICACIACIVRKLGGGLLCVALAWAVAAIGAYERFSMRPELFSYAVMMTQLAILCRRRWTRLSLTAVTILQVAWVNLHSYFIVGVVICGLFWAEGIFARWRQRQAHPSRVTSPGIRWASLLLALSIAACFLHPWGHRAALFPFRTLAFLEQRDVMGGAAGQASGSAWSEISEFQSPFSFTGQRINQFTIFGYFGVIALSLGALWLLFRRRAFGPALVLLALLAMSIQMRRNIAQFSLATAPLALGAIAALRPGPMRPAGRRVAAGALCVLFAAFVGAIASGRWYFHERRISREFGMGYSDRTIAHAAGGWIAGQAALQPNLFADYFSSSNLLMRLPDRFRLFVDTNTFAYEDATLNSAFMLGLGHLAHGPFFDQFHVNVVSLRCGPDTQMLVRAMAMDEGTWALVYVDPSVVIFVRRIQPHVNIILENPVSEKTIDMRKWIDSVQGSPAARALTLGTMANVPMSLGWWRSAIEICEAARAARPDYFEAIHYTGVAHMNLGNAAARAGHYDETTRRWRLAMDCFQKVLTYDANHEEASKYLRLLSDVIRDIPR